MTELKQRTGGPSGWLTEMLEQNTRATMANTDSTKGPWKAPDKLATVCRLTLSSTGTSNLVT